MSKAPSSVAPTAKDTSQDTKPKVYTSAIEENIFMARVCEQTQRFPDMVEHLTSVLTEKGPELSIDERNLFSVACKNLLASNRTAWRTVMALLPNPKYTKYGKSLREYKELAEKKITEDSEKVIELITTHVLAKATNDEAKAFFVKMVADYHRYVSEVTTGERHE